MVDLRSGWRSKEASRERRVSPVIAFRAVPADDLDHSDTSVRANGRAKGTRLTSAVASSRILIPPLRSPAASSLSLRSRSPPSLASHAAVPHRPDARCLHPFCLRPRRQGEARVSGPSQTCCSEINHSKPLFRVTLLAYARLLSTGMHNPLDHNHSVLTCQFCSLYSHRSVGPFLCHTC